MVPPSSALFFISLRLNGDIVVVVFVVIRTNVSFGPSPSGTLWRANSRAARARTVVISLSNLRKNVLRVLAQGPRRAHARSFSKLLSAIAIVLLTELHFHRCCGRTLSITREIENLNPSSARTPSAAVNTRTNAGGRTSCGDGGRGFLAKCARCAVSSKCTGGGCCFCCWVHKSYDACTRTHALPFPPFSANKAISCIKASDKKMSLSRCQQKKNSRVLGGFGQRMYFCEYCVCADGYLHLRSTSYRFSIKAAGGARGRVVRVRGYDGAATRHAFAPVAVAMEL